MILDGSGALRDVLTTYQGGCATPPGNAGDSLSLSTGALGVTAIAWTATPGFSAWNLYRGTLGGGALASNHVCFESASGDPAAADPQTPPPRSLHYYQVSGSNACGEGSLGADSAGAPRPTLTSCP